jgi:hypothetical protein
MSIGTRKRRYRLVPPEEAGDNSKMDLGIPRHQRVSYASGDFDAKYIPGIVFLVPGIAKIQFTVTRSCGIPNSPFVNFVLAYS